MSSNIKYIIGDSPVRAFAYNNAFAAFVIAAGAFNSHLTIESSKNVSNRYSIFFDSFDLNNEDIYFFSSADTFHLYRNTFNLDLDNYESLLKDSATRYINMIMTLRDNYSIKVNVISPIPINNKEGFVYSLHYHQQIKELCTENNLNYYDIWPFIISDNKNKPVINDFVADPTGHLNDRFVYSFLKTNNIIQTEKHYGLLYDKYYFIEYINDELKTPVKFWGDFDKNKLIINDDYQIKWDNYHQNSHTDLFICKMALEVLKEYISNNNISITIDGAKEGLLVQYFRNNTNGSITAYEDHPIAFDFLRLLVKNHKMLDTQIHNENSFNESHSGDLLIALTKSLYSKKNKLKLFKQAFLDYKFLVYKSTDKSTDLKLLKKVGFTIISDMQDITSSKIELFINESVLICSNNSNVKLKNVNQTSLLVRNILSKLTRKFI